MWRNSVKAPPPVHFHYRFAFFLPPSSEQNADQLLYCDGGASSRCPSERHSSLSCNSDLAAHLRRRGRFGSGSDLFGAFPERGAEGVGEREMTTLQKFKLLATQCAVVGSPSRSPTTSPVVHLRRRRTLRMLLNRADRRRFPRREGSPEQDPGRQSPPENPARFRARHKLRDLFVSSSPPPPPLPPIDGAPRPERRLEGRERLQAEAGTGTGGGGGGGGARRGGAGGSIRPLSAAFRYRLLRRPWRPVLVAIPE